jgi:hypothetical protein
VNSAISRPFIGVDDFYFNTGKLVPPVHAGGFFHCLARLFTWQGNFYCIGKSSTIGNKAAGKTECRLRVPDYIGLITVDEFSLATDLKQFKGREINLFVMSQALFF